MLTEEQRELVTQHVPLIRWLAHRNNMLPDYEERVSVACLAVCRAMHRFNEARGDVKAFIGGVCRYAWLEARKYESYRECEELEVEPATEHEWFDDAEDAAALLKHLSPREIAVVDGWMEGATDRDMGRRLGMNHTRVGQIRRAAIARLREAFACG